MPIPFSQRHVGPDEEQIKNMLSHLGFSSLDEFINETIPKDILSNFTFIYPIKLFFELYKFF